MTLFHEMKHRRARILFVCVGNSYRSRMAEAFANAYAPDLIEAESAGLIPARRCSRTAQRLMREKGLELAPTLPRKFVVAEAQHYDLIVNLCDYGLPKVPCRSLKVALPDPSGKDEILQRAIRDHVEKLVEILILQFRQARFAPVCLRLGRPLAISA